MHISKLYRWMGSPAKISQDTKTTARPSSRSWPLVIGVIAFLGIAAGFTLTGNPAESTFNGIVRALWILPALVALHLSQLLLAGLAWQAMLPDMRPGLGTFYRLRIIREGIDSLLPVAQVGGEVVGAKLLSGHAVPLPRAAASVVVDVSIEFFTQVAFLALGLAALFYLTQGTLWGTWAGAMLVAAGAACAFLLAQRLGVLRLLEAVWRGIARRWPTLAGTSLDGLDRAAHDLYRQPKALTRSAWLHLLAWALGSVETWAVLRALSIPVSPAQSFIVESLGMAGRSAGFAIPAALGAQEGGFVLAAAAIGIGAQPALALSILKRIREVLVGSIGLWLWRAATVRRVA